MILSCLVPAVICFIALFLYMYYIESSRAIDIWDIILTTIVSAIPVLNALVIAVMTWEILGRGIHGLVELIQHNDKLQTIPGKIVKTFRIVLIKPRK